MEKVGELHVDGSHGAGVLHDPVFVHIWRIVVAGGAKRAQRRGSRHRYVNVFFYLDSMEHTCVLRVQ